MLVIFSVSYKLTCFTFPEIICYCIFVSSMSIFKKKKKIVLLNFCKFYAFVNKKKFKPTDVSITVVTVQADGLSHNSVSAIES